MCVVRFDVGNENNQFRNHEFLWQILPQNSYVSLVMNSICKPLLVIASCYHVMCVRQNLICYYVGLESLTDYGFKLDWLKKKLDQVTKRKRKRKLVRLGEKKLRKS
ncbi:unnamed protein product [Arabidopsis halleri]